MGINSKDPTQPAQQEPVDKRKPPYDVLAHFDKVPKLCHSPLKKLGYVKTKAGKHEWVEPTPEDPETEGKKKKKKSSEGRPKEKMPKLTERPKPTSNNLKLDKLGGKERKYLVITL